VHVGDQRGERLIDAPHHPPRADAVAPFAAGFVADRAAGAVGVNQVVMIPVHVEAAGR
jgi:hypothetical protein